MEKIERYLDEVCRRIGGPRAMRAHVRQELREHLLDAVESLRSSGLGEEEAVAKALEDFGGPEEMRGALEEAHGHRLTAVIVEKAMQWKEKTMKARWLWMTLAHVAVLKVILLEVVFVYAAMIFVVPKFREMLQDGWLDTGTGVRPPATAWAADYLGALAWWCENGIWLLLAVGAVWAVFEWRVHSENKSWVRLFLLGVGAVKMFVVAAVTAAALILPPLIAIPLLRQRAPEADVRHDVADVEIAMRDLGAAQARSDWNLILENLNRAWDSAEDLHELGAAGPTLLSEGSHEDVDKVRYAIRDARNALRDAKKAAALHDTTQMNEAIQKFQEAWRRARGSAATQP